MKLKHLFAVAAGGLVLSGGCTALTTNWVYSEGARVGTVSKFSHKGYVSKTWEGELATSNFKQDANGRLGNTFAFSAQNDAVIQKLEEARDNEQQVKLQYKQTVSHFPWARDSNYIIVDVQPVNGAKAAKPLAPAQ